MITIKRDDKAAKINESESNELIDYFVKYCLMFNNLAKELQKKTMKREFPPNLKHEIAYREIILKKIILNQLRNSE